jgi:hypothetical protein
MRSEYDFNCDDDEYDDNDEHNDSDDYDYNYDYDNKDNEMLKILFFVCVFVPLQKKRTVDLV